ncbi:MAG TPA: hypothetical protein DDY13_16080, partial [Cytophagales bacterium]|nr:hypothetical protein [Cytophagales bacterium]
SEEALISVSKKTIKRGTIIGCAVIFQLQPFMNLGRNIYDKYVKSGILANIQRFRKTDPAKVLLK